jgi:hypothetical protein
LPKAKVQALQQGFTGAIKQKLTGHASRVETQEAMVRICRENLDEREVATLMDTFKAELTPLTGP